MLLEEISLLEIGQDLGLEVKVRQDLEAEDLDLAVLHFVEETILCLAEVHLQGIPLQITLAVQWASMDQVGVLGDLHLMALLQVQEDKVLYQGRLLC